jgi:hypothetical protein
MNLKSIIICVFSLCVVMLISSCHCCKKNQTVAEKKSESISSTKQITGPATVIYKTKADYSKFIPVVLSDDGSKIISYPDPQDVKDADMLRTPSALHQGYWLDNKGISLKTVFINITYEEYSKMASPPSLQEMYSKIIDKNPFTEFYACDLRASFGVNIIDAVNDMIDKGNLKNCKCLKK